MTALDRSRLRTVLGEEWNGSQPRLLAAMLVTRFLPDLVGNRLRVSALRWAGVAIGHGTVIGGGVRIVGTGRTQDRIVIGERGWINAGCYFDVSERIDLGNDVAVGQQVLFLTQSHVLGGDSRRAGALSVAPIRIDDGCWIGARAVILPGVTVGAGAVVAAGAVVTKHVSPNTMVAGVPARQLRRLDAPLESAPG